MFDIQLEILFESFFFWLNIQVMLDRLILRILKLIILGEQEEIFMLSFEVYVKLIISYDIFLSDLDTRRVKLFLVCSRYLHLINFFYVQF